MGFELTSLPGYMEAVEREGMIRDAAFLGVTEHVGPFECLPLTLRHYLILRLRKSPLLYKQLPDPFELGAFLWIVSPDYKPNDELARLRFLKRCRAFTPQLPPRFKFKWAMQLWEQNASRRLDRCREIGKAALDYVEEAMMDRPATAATLGWEAPYYSIACGICAKMREEAGYTEEQTLSTPLKRVFQYWKYSLNQAGKTARLSNPSEKVLNRELDRINAEIRRN